MSMLLNPSRFTPPAGAGSTLFLISARNGLLEDLTAKATALSFANLAGVDSTSGIGVFGSNRAFKMNLANSGSDKTTGISITIPAGLISNHEKTLEMWVKMISGTPPVSNRGIYVDPGNIERQAGFNSSGNFNWYSPSGYVQTGNKNAGITSGSWHHVAMVTKETSPGTFQHKAYVDGLGGAYYNAANALISTLLYFGRGSTLPDNCAFPGYIDEIRLSNTCLYSANFTPPTARW